MKPDIVILLILIEDNVEISQAPMNPELEEELKNNSQDNGISCTAAMKIADKLSITYKEVGAVANELGIKIKNCQFGCF